MYFAVLQHHHWNSSLTVDTAVCLLRWMPTECNIHCVCCCKLSEQCEGSCSSNEGQRIAFDSNFESDLRAFKKYTGPITLFLFLVSLFSFYWHWMFQLFTVIIVNPILLTKTHSCKPLLLPACQALLAMANTNHVSYFMVTHPNPPCKLSPWWCSTNKLRLTSYKIVRCPIPLWYKYCFGSLQ